MSHPTPRVSIGLPIYNGERFLAEAVRSMLDQTFTDFELIIVDNASTDGTEALCRAFAAEDPRIRYVRNERNLGAAGNFNKAFHLARGAYFKWTADDDYCTPDFLARCVAALDAAPEAVLATAGARLINEDGSALGYDPEQGAYVDALGKAWYLDANLPAGLGASNPAERFGAVLLHTTMCVEVFGLIRSDALRRTSLIGAYYGSDKVLLAELSLMGRFTQVAEAAFVRRCHARQSGHQTTKEREAWIAGRRRRLVFPQGRVFVGYCRALRRTALSASQRLQATRTLGRYVARPDKLRRLILPGPDNLLGLEKGWSHASSRLLVAATRFFC